MSDSKFNLKEEMLKFNNKYKKGNLKEAFIEEIKKSVPKNRTNKITFTKNNIIYVAEIIDLVLTEKKKTCKQDQGDLLFYNHLYYTGDIKKYIMEILENIRGQNGDVKINIKTEIENIKKREKNKIKTIEIASENIDNIDEVEKNIQKALENLLKKNDTAEKNLYMALENIRMINEIENLEKALINIWEKNKMVEKDKSILQSRKFKPLIEKIFDYFKLTDFQSYVSKLDLLKRILNKDRILVPIFLAVNKENEFQYAPYRFSINQFMFLLSAIVSPPIINHFDFGYLVDDKFTLNIQCCHECPEFLCVVIPLLCEMECFESSFSAKLLKAFGSNNFNLEGVKYSLKKVCNPTD